MARGKEFRIQEARTGGIVRFKGLVLACIMIDKPYPHYHTLHWQVICHEVGDLAMKEST